MNEKQPEKYDQQPGYENKPTQIVYHETKRRLDGRALFTTVVYNWNGTHVGFTISWS